MRKLFFFIIILSAASFSFAQDKRYDIPVVGSPTLGAADAPVTIIEFLDFQ